MPIELRVPQMGESIFEATVGRWLKGEGDRVQAGETVLELETEKVNVEVSAPQAGVLEKVIRQTGETVRVGEPLGVIAEATAPGTEERPAEAAPQRQERAWAAPAPQVDRVAKEADEVMATPVARRIAARHGIDLSLVRGTGREGRITQEDVERFLAQVRERQTATEAPTAPSAAPVQAAPQPAPVAGPGRHEERVRLSRRRQTIARRLVEAHQTAVMTTTFNEVDMSGILELRSRRRAAFKERHGVDLGLMSFFVKATIGALKAFPQFNAELQGDELIYKYYYDIGIAVGSEEGLVVPVLRDADKLSFAEIEAAIADLVTRTQQRKLRLEELQGGTFTITNGGVFGSMLSTPLLNPPQVGILGMHRFVERPVAINGQVVVRPVMYLALTYDHRAVDGRDAVLFLVRIKELLEDPARLLLEV